ncbi:MAG: dihydrodipicolinate synthase family protein [Rhodospirillales bacterium]|jgi:4-hydroxy-2-oxoglutarate aldolase|nr:dihydrodipicolinate synthase family protein [Rhodospirillales bacterium]
MTAHLEKISGVFAPVVTPFAGDELVEDDLRFNLKKLGQSGVAGYLALGSNGEYKSLTDAEQRRVLEIFAEEKGDKVVMVGCGCESTRQTIEKCKITADLGLDFASVLTPSYFPKRMDAPTLTDFYTRIADESPVPVLLYNAPGFAGGVTIPLKAIIELSTHPNIAGVKDSSSAGPAGMLSALDPNGAFRVLAGSVGFFYPSLHLGATGGIVSLANVLPDPCCDLYDLFLEGRYDEAAILHQKLSRLNRAVSGSGGVAGVKAGMDVAGFKGGEPRHPLKPADDAARDAIRKAILAEGFQLP